MMKRDKQQGFTLVELILYMGLLSILLTVLTSLFVSILEVKSDTEATSAVEQDGRFLLTRMRYDILRAQTISIPTPSQLVLTFATPPNLTYSLSSGKLELNDGLVSQLNSSETIVDTLTFDKTVASSGKDSVKINFTISSKNQEPTIFQTKNFSTSVGRR